MSDEKKVWVATIRTHSYYPQIKAGSHVLVKESDVPMVEKRVAIVNSFFKNRFYCNCERN